MSASAFDRLLYTDCRVGQGRGAGGGFQVQAQSAGVDAAQVKLAKGKLLYEAPNAWIVQGRAVADFPLGFAHACEEGYGTAQSRYLGTEATGARQGNHLADCLLTRDADRYGPTRPAQLWLSSLWRSQAWETTECPQFDDAPPLGPLTVDAVAEWLSDRPERQAALARLLTLVEDPDPRGRRVVITSAAPDEAMKWIAAATLLLPIRAALGVSFKVFCPNPTRADYRVIAVPKELNPDVVPGRSTSAFVLDADTAVSDETDVSERATFWTGLLASAEDPYDVIDAVELAWTLAGGAGHCERDPMLTAWAVTVPDSPLTDPQALFRWLSGADPELQAEHGPAVVRRILAARPPAAALRWIDDAAASGRVDADRPAVRAALLSAELAEARTGIAPQRRSLVPAGVDPSAARDAESDLTSALLLGTDPQIDLLLRLARRHGIEPQLAPLKDRLRDFVTGWVDHPGRAYGPADWALRDEIFDIAHAELRARLVADGAPRVMTALKRLGPFLADRLGDPTDPLDCHLAMAQLSALPAQQRPGQLHALLQRARQSANVPATVADIQRALVGWRILGPSEAVVLLVALPESVPVAREVAEEAVPALVRQARDRPTPAVLDALRALDRHGLAPSVPPVPELIAADRDIARFIAATRSPRFASDQRYAEDTIEALSRVPAQATSARLGTLLRVSLESPLQWLGATIIDVLSAPMPRQFVDLWTRELAGQRAARAAAWGVYWACDDYLPDKVKSDIAAAVSELASSLSPADREQWFAAVREHLDAEREAVLAELAGYEVAQPKGGRHGRRKEKAKGKDARAKDAP